MKYLSLIIFLTQLSLFPSIGYSKAKGSNEILTLAVSQDFDQLNPLFVETLVSYYVNATYNRGLNFIDDSGNWSTHIAKDIPSLENKLAYFTGKGANKRIVAKWEIKENAKWGDGTHVTGKDVLFSWQVATHKNVTVSTNEEYATVKNIVVDKKNPKKFKVYYKGANWNFNQLANFRIIPKHLEEPIFNKNKGKLDLYARHSNYVKNPTMKGLYNGPYLVASVKFGSHLILTPNPHFYKAQAGIKKIVIKVISDTSSIESNLRSGNIDMVSVLGFSFDQAMFLEKSNLKNKFNINFKPSLTYEHIDLNLSSNQILQDLNVRKALIFSINREKLTKALFNGKQKVALHNVAPMDPRYTSDHSRLKTYEYNKVKAIQLFEKSGWILSKDGYRYKKDKKLSFTIMTTAGNKTRETVQVYLQSELKKVGVELKIKNEPARVLFGETIQKLKYPAMTMYAWTNLPEESLTQYLHSKSIPSSKNKYSGRNYMAWSNKAVDKLLLKIENEFDEKKRAKLTHKVLYHYTNEVPVIPLYYRSDISVTPKKLKGYRLTGNNFTPTHHIEEWSIKK